jgi:hypothetical protein
MIKILFRLLLIFCFSQNCFSQINEIANNNGFERSDTSAFKKLLSQADLEKYVHALKTDSDSRVLGGYVISIFHEPVDSAKIFLQVDGKVRDSVITDNGLFRIAISNKYLGKTLHLAIETSDFHPFDTSFIWNYTDTVIQTIQLSPRLTILLRGRVYAGSLPLEGVDVLIRQNKGMYKTKSLNCFNDKENYWNCLFLGMFKQELMADNPSDSIYLTLEKDGLRPLRFGMTFSDYTGEIMDLKMKYASRLPGKISNNVNLKFAFPFTTSLGDWYVGLSYYRLLKISNFNRLAVGIDGSLIIKTISTTAVDPPTGFKFINFDSTYINYFAGPSLLCWILNPNRRYFATFAGATFAYNWTGDDFRLQPFLGTRVVLDFNKALTLEVRYIGYDCDVTNYRFNLYGNAYQEVTRQKYEELLINLGIQMLF